MSDLRVNRVRSLSGGTVEFVDGVSGNADGLRFAPKIVQYSPLALSTDVQVSTNQFQFTFDQPIKFYGTGTIQIIKSSNSSVYESFAITNGGTAGVGVTIAGNVLQLDTSAGNFEFFTNYHISFPGAGIAGTYNDPLTAQDGYTFRTGVTVFDVQGGDYEQVIVSPTSPTGYHKYHVFTSSGIATFSGPSTAADDFAYFIIGGGGGGGGTYYSGGGGGAGGYIKDYNSNNLPAGSYTVTIGAGGPGTFNNPGGTTAPPTNTPSTPGTWPVQASPGQNSSFGPTPVGTIVAYGGGRGGLGREFGYPSPSYQRPSQQNQSTPTYHQAGQPGGSGGGGTYGVSSPWSPPSYNPGYASSPNPNSGNFAGIFAGQGVSYPSPNQQGYPGGTTSVNPSPKWGGSTYMGGGGGGAGGSGGTVTNSPPQGPAGPNPNHKAGGGGGSGKPNPEFPGTQLALMSVPLTLTNEMGPGGVVGGGGGPAVYADSSASWPQGPNQYWTPNNSARGGNGGGGDGSYQTNPPNPNPTFTAQAGFENTGGGGGGGYTPGGPTGVFPTPGPGQWYGVPGGSGVMMIRYAHPGA
jgi:hypothetical protein